MTDHETEQDAHGDHDDGHTDCALVIAEVWMLLDGEITAERRDRLRLHLEQCPACLRHYGLEERVKRLIATRCGGETAPPALVERVRLEITRTTVIRWT